MPCCIDRMRFSPRFTIRREKALAAFSSFFFIWDRDLYVAPTPILKRNHEKAGSGFFLMKKARKPVFKGFAFLSRAATHSR